MSKTTSKARRQTKPAHAITANAAAIGQEAKDGANTSKARPETWKDFLQTPDEVIRKMDEAIRATQDRWNAEHPMREWTMKERRAQRLDLAKMVLTRNLVELESNGSPDAEWQIQTLMYRSGVVAHSPTGNTPDFEPSPELLDSSTLEHRPMDIAPRVHWQTGEKLPCIETTGSLRSTLDGLRVQHCIRYTGRRAAELLVANADIDPIASNAARRVAGHMLEQGNNLPPELSRFVADVLLNRATKPKRPGRRKGQKGNAIRDAAIQSTARLLEEHFGLGPLTRNDASPKSSICDLLAGALKSLHMAIGYEAVKKIVSKRGGYTRRLGRTVGRK